MLEGNIGQHFGGTSEPSSSDTNFDQSIERNSEIISELDESWKQTFVEFNNIPSPHNPEVLSNTITKIAHIVNTYKSLGLNMDLEDVSLSMPAKLAILEKEDSILFKGINETYSQILKELGR